MSNYQEKAIKEAHNIICSKKGYGYAPNTEEIGEVIKKDARLTEMFNGTYEPIEWTRIDNDVNGNPRYVCHFTNLAPLKDYYNLEISERYAIAVNLANKIGGRKYHTKAYGGGIVFQPYNIHDTERRIFELLKTGK